MKKAFKFFLYVVAIVSLIFLVAIIRKQGRPQQPWKNFEAPDDILIAREELSRNFDGPRYFHFTQITGDSLAYPYIPTSSADAQIKRIVKARSLPPHAVGTIENIIGQLSIHSPSRIAGGDRVNFLQLNLALDAMD